MKNVLWSLSAALVVHGASAQDLSPRSFLPRDYSVELRADMVALVDSGVWDIVERSMLRIALDGFRKQYGFDVADLDRARFAQRVDAAPDGFPDWQSQYVQVWVLEGSERVGTGRLPDDLKAQCGVSTVAGLTVYRSPYGAELVSPAPGVFVHARTIGMSYASDDTEEPPGLVTRTLKGDRRGGAPVPELVALTASPHALVVMAGVSSPGMPLDADTLQPFPEEWFDLDSPPKGVRVQLVRRPTDEALAFELLMRFESEAGVRRMAAGFDDTMAALVEDPETRGVAKLFEPVRKETDGADLTFVLELGTARQAATRLSQLLGAAVPLLFFTAGDATVEAVVEGVEAEAVEVLLEEPPVPDPPAGEKKKRK